ncbi:MAG: CPBP family intramembrane metalloprotease [Terrimonas sp.]|nr:CPBP family intramembrane metalloprotease [Terrimonas sp.]
MKKKGISIIAGFLLLFAVYHLPEFFSLFWLMAVCKIGFLILAFFIAVRQGWKGLGGFGLGLHQGWWKKWVAGIIAGFVFYGLSLWATVALGFERLESVRSFSSILQKAPLIILMTVFPSIDEDILTRGYLFGHFGKRLKPYLWVIVSAAVFLLNHIWRLGDHPSVLLYLFLLGLVLAIAVIQTGSLWLAFGIHWGANLAFESSQAFVQTQSVEKGYLGTWFLAGAWLMLMIILLIRGNYLSGSKKSET